MSNGAIPKKIIDFEMTLTGYPQLPILSCNLFQFAGGNMTTNNKIVVLYDLYLQRDKELADEIADLLRGIGMNVELLPEGEGDDKKIGLYNYAESPNYNAVLVDTHLIDNKSFSMFSCFIQKIRQPGNFMPDKTAIFTSRFFQFLGLSFEGKEVKIFMHDEDREGLIDFLTF